MGGLGTLAWGPLGTLAWGPLGLSLGLLQLIEHVCVGGGVHEARVRVPLHQGVDLLLGVLEGVGGGIQHVAG